MKFEEADVRRRDDEISSRSMAFFQGGEERCNLTCTQCIFGAVRKYDKASRSSSTQRCTRKVCIGLPFCFQHARSVLHLDIENKPDRGNLITTHVTDDGPVKVFVVTRRVRAYLPGASTTDTDPEVVFRRGQKIVDAKVIERSMERISAESEGSPYVVDGFDGACKRGLVALIERKPTGANVAIQGHDLVALQDISHNADLILEGEPRKASSKGEWRGKEFSDRKRRYGGGYSILGSTGSARRSRYSPYEAGSGGSTWAK